MNHFLGCVAEIRKRNMLAEFVWQIFCKT